MLDFILKFIALKLKIIKYIKSYEKKSDMKKKTFTITLRFPCVENFFSRRTKRDTAFIKWNMLQKCLN